MKKIFSALMLAVLLAVSCFAAASANSVTDNVRFLPQTITVSDRKVVVEGYFANLNSDRKLNYFTNFSLSVYRNGEVLVSGDFSGEVDCDAGALRMEKHTFTFTGTHHLNNGTYSCDDSVYASWSGTVNSSQVY